MKQLYKKGFVHLFIRSLQEFLKNHLLDPQQSWKGSYDFNPVRLFLCRSFVRL